jgi:hypothetical protein
MVVNRNRKVILKIFIKKAEDLAAEFSNEK